MAKLTDLATLAKTSVGSSDYLLVTNSTSGSSKRLTVASLFPAVSTAGSSSETLYNSATLTNKNQIVFKGIKSGDTDLLTVTTASSNIVLTALEAGIDLSLCNNTTSGFLSGVDFTGTVTGECPVVKGGTGLATIAKGSLLYASNTDTIASTGAGTNGQILVFNSTTGIPSWSSLVAGDNLTLDVSAAGVLELDATIGAMTADLDMANYNIDLGTGWISADGSTDQGIKVTAAKAFIGPTAGHHTSDVLNLYGGGIRFGNSANVTMKPNTPDSGSTGLNMTIEGGASAGSADAGNVNITGGTAAGTGQGGIITLTAGRDTSGSSDGTIIMKTYTSGTATAAITVGSEGQDVTVNTGDLIMSTGNIYMRNSSNPDVIKYQGTQATTDDGTTAVSAANILTGIVQCTPTADKSKATDTAANLISGLSLNADGDAFDFSFINLATDGSSHVTLTAGTDVALVGCMVISAQDLAQDAFTSGVGRFRIRRTASDATTLYRIG